MTGFFCELIRRWKAPRRRVMYLYVHSCSLGDICDYFVKKSLSLQVPVEAHHTRGREPSLGLSLGAGVYSPTAREGVSQWQRHGHYLGFPLIMEVRRAPSCPKRSASGVRLGIFKLKIIKEIPNLVPNGTRGMTFCYGTIS